MTARNDNPPEVGDRWRDAVVLKRDVFSTIERGRFLTPEGDVDAILRRLDHVPWWSASLARHLFKREKRALAIAGGLGIAPCLLFAGQDVLVRGFIDGVALHVARPTGDLNYFRSARRALRALHRVKITHNDLAKEQNWLRGADGNAYLTDFQLAFVYARRSKLFRIAAYEDIRHLLKHKRKYAPEALTAAEKRILSKKSLPTRIWMATGKRVYRGVTRGVFGFIDREGSGPRLVNDAPKIVAALKTSPQMRDAAVVAFPDRRTGVGLYAFVEATDVSSDEALKIIAAHDVAVPEHLQLVDALPRNAAGEIRTEILQLIAMNQLDLITPLVTNAAEFAVIARIVAGRQNLRDRFSY
jgi:predicted Ser/Thr protein kinase